MCGRYGRRADKQRIAEWFHTHNTDVFNDEYCEINSTRLAPSYNISPEGIQPVVRIDRDTGVRVLALMKRGLVPYGSKAPKASFSSINARSDKLESSGAWREPRKHRRCLIPAEFFYEWEPLTREEESHGRYRSQIAGRNLDLAAEHTRVRGVRDRLDSHRSGRRSGDQFAVYVCDRLVLQTLSQAARSKSDG